MGILASLSGFAGYQSISITRASGDEYQGATMVFAQTAAPTGWVKETTYDDYTLRVTTGTISTGGSVAFGTMNTDTTLNGTATLSGTAVGGTTISSTTLPTHLHGPLTVNGAVSRSPSPSPTVPAVPYGTFSSGASITSGTTWSGGSHVHSISPGTTASANAPFTMSVRYVDTMLATKS
jgi:hypothetical protein